MCTKRLRRGHEDYNLEVLIFMERSPSAKTAEINTLQNFPLHGTALSSAKTTPTDLLVLLYTRELLKNRDSKPQVNWNGQADGANTTDGANT